MPRLQSFKLPDLGEGLTEGEILQWLVATGDEVKLNQPIVEVETAKAAVEVPSPFAGVVTELHFAAGETVDVGAVIITFDTDPTAGPLAGPGSPAAAASGAAPGPVADSAVTAAHPEVGDLVPPPPAQAGVAGQPPADGQPVEQLGALIGEVGPTGRTATLVGYGPKSVVAKRRARTGSSAVLAQAPTQAPAAVAPAVATPTQAAPLSSATDGLVASALAPNGLVTNGSPARGSVLAKPPVRKLAKDHGIDLSRVPATGPNGTVSRADVEAAVAGGPAAETAETPTADPGSADQSALHPPRTPEVFDAQRERRIPVKGVRKMTAQAMVGSAFTAPHVTEFLTLDMTESMELLPRLRAMPEFAGVKVTPLLLVAKALLLAVRRNPEINSTYTDEAVVVKEYVNLGIAAATPRGLLVPNVKDAGTLSLADLARALQALTETAREGRTSPADMARGTITITNVGVFGVDSGTPILNPGESAILCFGAVRPTPWVHDGVIAIRQVTTLSLSFDHRNVDGQLGSQFLADIARVLADPATALAWG